MSCGVDRLQSKSKGCCFISLPAPHHSDTPRPKLKTSLGSCLRQHRDNPNRKRQQNVVSWQCVAKTLGCSGRDWLQRRTPPVTPIGCLHACDLILSHLHQRSAQDHRKTPHLLLLALQPCHCIPRLQQMYICGILLAESFRKVVKR